MTSFITESNRVGELDKKKNRKSPSNTQWKQKRKKKKCLQPGQAKNCLDLLFPTYLGKTSLQNKKGEETPTFNIL